MSPPPLPLHPSLTLLFLLFLPHLPSSIPDVCSRGDVDSLQVVADAEDDPSIVALPAVQWDVNDR